MEISIIFINFNSQVLLEKCLKSIERKIKDKTSLKKIEVIVVNNEEKVLALKKTFNLKIKIIENKKNLGFGKACNIGAQRAQGKYLFFLNPDTELLTDNFSIITDQFQKNPRIGIIGTKVIEKNKNLPQPWTCGKKTSLLRILFKNSVNKPWNKKKPVIVDWVSGTSFFIKKASFQKLNGFDENFFMYFEDQDLCLRLQKINEVCLFFPYFSVLHYDGKSWNNNIKKKSNYYQSQNYFFKKHHSQLHYLILVLTKKLLNK
ncbi:MAG: glycosyltransferase family 2 protein [Candidatus Moranbacteria bacterium]|nr:glycosyltransferase family 2 protein [Candidatus Moranbacteria bacterium]